MTADDAACAQAVPADPIPVPPQAVAAAERLRGALGSAGFDVDSDFEIWRAEVMIDGTGVVGIGRLSVPTATRLAQVLDRCAAAGRRIERGAGATGRPARRRSRRGDEREPDDARTAEVGLRAQLGRVGLDAEWDFERCAADVTTSGLGLVVLGRLPVVTADILSALIEADAAPRLGS